MKRLFTILLLLSSFSAQAQVGVQVTNEINGTFGSASYDTLGDKWWGDYFASYFYDMYPQFTNHIYSVSRADAWQSHFENQEQKWCLPLWNSFAVPGNDWQLANDNGGYTSNDVVHWGTNIFNAPPLFWNGVAITNEGIATAGITHFAMGHIPADTAGGDSGAIARNAGSLSLDTLYGTMPVDMWHMLATNGWLSDITGARLLGFFPGGHPYPAGHLCMALKSLIALGVETNVGSFTLDWNNQLVAATNKVTVINPSLAGRVLTCTVHFDRMPPAWDVPDGTITNDARAAFTVMPELVSAFQWIIQVTNLPSGNYSVTVDGVLTDTATSAELSAGRNWFTNYNGPLWAQRVEVLGRKRDQAGADRISVAQAHSAGTAGTLGVGDLVQFYSNAGFQYDTSGKRGATYVSAMSSFVSNVQLYDVAIHAAAVQTNHTITFTLAPTRYFGHR